MPVAKNQKETSKMILEDAKKKLPRAAKDFCRIWYRKHYELREIVSEADFVKMVGDSLRISVSSGKLEAKIELFKNRDIPQEHMETMVGLWNIFGTDCMQYIQTKIFK